MVLSRILSEAATRRACYIVNDPLLVLLVLLILLRADLVISFFFLATLELFVFRLGRVQQFTGKLLSFPRLWCDVFSVESSLEVETLGLDRILELGVGDLGAGTLGTAVMILPTYLQTVHGINNVPSYVAQFRIKVESFLGVKVALVGKLAGLKAVVKFEDLSLTSIRLTGLLSKSQLGVRTGNS